MSDEQKPEETIEVPIQSVDLLFPALEVSIGEMLLLGTHFTDPVTQKYLLSLGRNMVKELATIPVIGVSDKEIADAHRTILGRLDTINTLLQIENPNPTT